jgi:hypothetical protein
LVARLDIANSKALLLNLAKLFFASRIEAGPRSWLFSSSVLRGAEIDCTPHMNHLPENNQ